jgi:phospholipid/cholesterol/gamma-HCH transport system substrate-binding protein
MTRTRSTLVKFGVFATVMVVLTAFLFMAFGEYRSGSTAGYSAVFKDASRLKAGDSVRVAGVRVGTVDSVSLQPDSTVLVKFDADRDIKLTTGTNVAVRYLNLVGDRTAAALDLDLLLGGLRPVIQGLDPQDVNALTSSLIQVLQGQGDALDSLMSRTSSFSTTLADNNEVVQQLIENLNAVMGTLAKDGGQFDATVDRLEQLVSGLSQDRDPIGEAVTALDNGTASIAGLLTQARPHLKADIEQINWRGWGRTAAGSCTTSVASRSE